MSTFNVNDIVRVSSIWLADGVDQQVNVLDLQITNTPPSNDADVLQDIGDYLELVYIDVVPFINTTITHAGYEVANVTGHTVYGMQGARSALDGTSSGERLPNQNAALLLMNTTRPRFQGRKYLPSASEGANTNGALSSGYVTAIQALAVALMDEHTMDNGTHLQYVVARSAAFFAVPVGYRVVPTFRIQRRRQPGRGS